MTRGRKPKPTALKMLLGNPGKRPLNSEEPQPQAALPAKPEHLGPAASQLWDELAPLLVEQRILTRLDGLVLAATCQLWQRIVDAEAKVNGLGLLVLAQTGDAKTNPYIGIANAAYKELRPYLAELGLSPSSRSRLKIAPTGKQTSRLETFLARSGQKAS